MFAPLLALSLLAAPPRAPKAVLQAPRAAALADLRAFLQTASTYAPTLSPGALGRALGGALAIDVLDPSGWAAAGLDPKGPAWAELSDSGDALMLGVTTSKAVLARARASLPSSGAVSERKRGGATLLVARSSTGEVTAAVAVSARRAAIWLGGADPAFLLGAVRARPPSAERSVDGALTARLRADGTLGMTVGLAPSARALSVDAVVANRGSLLASGGRDAFAKLALTAPWVAHAALSRRGLSLARAQAEAMLHGLLDAPGKAFPTRQVAAVLDPLAGPVAALGTGLNPALGKGQGVRAAYFLVRQAEAGQVRDPAQARAALDALVKALEANGLAVRDAQAKAPGAHHQLSVAGRTLYFGLTGAVLYLASDAGARDALLGALPTSAGAEAHAGAVQVNGPLASAALGHLSIFDAAGSRALTALFAAAVEAGPLLRTLAPTTFTLDADPRGARLRGTLSFIPARAP